MIRHQTYLQKLLLLLEDFDHLTFNLLLIAVVQRKYNLMFSNMNLCSGQRNRSLILQSTHIDVYYLQLIYSMQNGLPGIAV
jgi:hypothetical protein